MDRRSLCRVDAVGLHVSLPVAWSAKSSYFRFSETKPLRFLDLHDSRIVNDDLNNAVTQRFHLLSHRFDPLFAACVQFESCCFMFRFHS